MTLWMVFAGLSAAVLALLLVPLLRRRGAAEGRVDYDLAVYRDQLKEVEGDLERGLLTPQQAEAARTEVKRRMLAAGEQADTPVAVSGRGWAMALVVALLVPAGAAALYGRLGAPRLPDQPYLDRQASRLDMPEADAKRMIEMVDKLATRLATTPDDQQGWVMLARSYKALARYDQAADAFRHVIDLGVRDGETYSSLAESLVLGGDGRISPEAAQWFARALAVQPGEPRARYYLGEARMQEGDARGAIAIWRDMEKDAPADAPWLESVRSRIAAVAADFKIDPATVTPAAPAVPAQAGGEAAAPAADQEATIRAMVERLAAKLQENPDDAAGWARLGRSYLVLGDAAKAREAYGKADKLNPFDVDIKMGLAEAIFAADGNPQQLPKDFVEVMRQVQAMAPENPDALYFVGLAEVQAGQPGKARELWGKLLEQMPKDSPERKDLQKQIDGLGG